MTSSAKISALKRGIGEWEEKQARLLAQWEDKQAENQMLLRDRERQSQHEGEQEERLGLLAADISELQGRLLAAEDGKMQAEVALQSIVCQVKDRSFTIAFCRGTSTYTVLLHTCTYTYTHTEV